MNEQKPVVSLGDSGLLRIRLDIAYDGAPFAGWAVQPGLVTVQGIIEDALFTLLRRRVRLSVAGRTDAGVHARGQVVHIDLTVDEWAAMSRGRSMPQEEALLRRLTGTVNRGLSEHLTGRGRSSKNTIPAVVVKRVSVAPPGFDARFSALWRRYSYRIADSTVERDPLGRYATLWYPGELDEGLLNTGASMLRGLQDFRAFCKPRQGATTVRELQRYEFARVEDGVITATIQADAFCHNMVRALIGSTLRVGSGELPPSWLEERLALRLKDQKSVLAPPHPLVLEEVRYPAAGQLRERAQATRARRIMTAP